MTIATSMKNAQFTSSIPLKALYTPSRPIEIPAHRKSVRPPIPSPLKCPPSPDLIFPMSPERVTEGSSLRTYPPLTPNTLHNPYEEPTSQGYPVNVECCSPRELFMYSFPTPTQNNVDINDNQNHPPASVASPPNQHKISNHRNRTKTHEHSANLYQHRSSNSWAEKSHTKSVHVPFATNCFDFLSPSSIQPRIHPLIAYRSGHMSQTASSASCTSGGERGSERCSSADTELIVLASDHYSQFGMEDEKYSSVV